MSTVPIKDAADATRKIDTFQRTEGPDTVETQAVAVVDPTTGTPIDFATQTTVAALLTAANAIKAAAESLDAKATAINTGAVAGTVAVSNMVAAGLTDTQLRATPLQTALTAVGAEYWPGYSGSPDPSDLPLHVDPSGALITRGAVTTDEGTFRVNFANTSLAVAIGSVSVAGDVVTGTGFLAADAHYKDYFKLDADAESAWVGIDSIDSDTQLTLRVPYVGGSSGAASRALVRPVTGSGGSIAVASGQCTLTTGTTANAVTRIVRDMDFAPLIYRARVSISQRIANELIRIGGSEAFTTTDRWFARFRAEGTVNTVLVCESGRNPTTTPSVAETESTTITLPFGLTTAALLDYRIEQLTESVRFYVNGVLVAEHTRAIPAQHDEMEFAVTCINGSTPPASSTTVVVDYATGKNHNKLEVGVMSDAERIVAAAVPLQLFTYSVAGVIAINTDLLVLDCSQIRSLFIQCNSMGTTGVVTVQWSNTADFAQPITATLLSEAGAASTTFNAAVLRAANVMARYCRLRLTTATTAGTTTLNVWGAQTAYQPAVTTQPVSGTVGITGYPTAAASADALANPTVTQVGAAALAFNGTTWDRVRGMSTALTTGDTGAKVATGNGATITNIGNKGVQIVVNMGAVSGTTPTAVLKVQGSTDAGTTWYDIPGATTASLTATGQYGITIYPGVATTAGVATTGTTATTSMVIPRTWRMVWTIGGTTPSFTITAVQYIYLPN